MIDSVLSLPLLSIPISSSSLSWSTKKSNSCITSSSSMLLQLLKFSKGTLPETLANLSTAPPNVTFEYMPDLVLLEFEIKSAGALILGVKVFVMSGGHLSLLLVPFEGGLSSKGILSPGAHSSCAVANGEIKAPKSLVLSDAGFFSLVNF